MKKITQTTTGAKQESKKTEKKNRVYYVPDGNMQIVRKITEQELASEIANKTLSDAYNISKVFNTAEECKKYLKEYNTVYYMLNPFTGNIMEGNKGQLDLLEKTFHTTITKFTDLEEITAYVESVRTKCRDIAQSIDLAMDLKANVQTDYKSGELLVNHKYVKAVQDLAHLQASLTHCAKRNPTAVISLLEA